MASFTDANGNEWTVQIDIPTVKELKKQDLDVLAMFEGEMQVFEKVIGDPITLVDTLWIVCKEQTDQGETAFAKALVGDALMRAAHALVEAVIDFFPDPKRRQALKEMFRKIKETEAILLDNVEREMAALGPDEMAEAIRNALGEKSGESQDSLESTPA